MKYETIGLETVQTVGLLVKQLSSVLVLPYLQFLKILTDGAIMVQIWGKQVPHKKKNVNTRNAMLTAAATKGQNHCANQNVKVIVCMHHSTRSLKSRSALAMFCLHTDVYSHYLNV